MENMNRFTFKVQLLYVMEEAASYIHNGLDVSVLTFNWTPLDHNHEDVVVCRKAVWIAPLGVLLGEDTIRSAIGWVMQMGQPTSWNQSAKPLYRGLGASIWFYRHTEMGPGCPATPSAKGPPAQTHTNRSIIPSAINHKYNTQGAICNIDWAISNLQDLINQLHGMYAA